MPLTKDEDLRALLQSTQTIALVGASNKPERDSFKVMRFLQSQGYRVIPVNPGLVGSEINGEPVVAALGDISERVDLVDIFRASDSVGPVVDAAIAIGARAIWMQLGVINAPAAATAEAAGLKVVMDHCPKIEIPRLGLLKAG